MDLAVIIVNWNSVRYLDQCLETLFEQTSGLEFEVIVIDNASYDGCDKMIENKFKEVIFIQSNENIGFAKANNLGYEHSSGEVLLFLNPDTEIRDQAIKKMFSALQTLPDAGAIGCKLLNTDMSLQTSSVHAFPTILNQLLNFDFFRKLFPRSALWGTKPLFMDSGQPEVVEAVSGACFMIKRGIFERVKMFSSDYFLYSEELDLCYKIKNVGFKIYYLSIAEIIHHGNKSAEMRTGDFSSDVMMRESIQKFLLKTRGKAYGLAFRMTTALAAVCRLSLMTLSLPLTGLAFNRKKLLASFSKWQRIFRWTLGLEKWAKTTGHR